MRRRSNCSTFRCPARPIRWRVAALRCKSPSACASAVGSCGGTRSPVSPWSTASTIPPALVATTGRARAMASRMLVPSPSVFELMTKTSAARSLGRTSSVKPGRNTSSSRPSCLVWRSRSARSSPSPRMTSLPEPSASRNRRKALMSVVWSLCGASAATLQKRSSPGSSPKRMRHPRSGSTPSKREKSMPLGTRRMRSAAIPACTSSLSTAELIARKRSTRELRYFHRLMRLRPTGKSTRRDTTSFERAPKRRAHRPRSCACEVWVCSTLDGSRRSPRSRQAAPGSWPPTIRSA